MKIWSWCISYLPFMYELDLKIKELELKLVKRTLKKIK
jgi:hypothetical protein